MIHTPCLALMWLRLQEVVQVRPTEILCKIEFLLDQVSKEYFTTCLPKHPVAGLLEQQSPTDTLDELLIHKNQTLDFLPFGMLIPAEGEELSTFKQCY